ncbi:unnamed protein product [Hymenolepis diminuta]|uniref:Pv-fam-g protein n=1 Tax=Hymenolepis diminuta TaxID=6216 RepID=A0A0R3S977_HYMDI|nr:unnamed protein product [Hymenolepis diminuta]
MNSSILVGLNGLVSPKQSKNIPIDSNISTLTLQQNHTPYPMDQPYPYPNVGNSMPPVSYPPPEMGKVPIPSSMTPPHDAPPPYNQSVDQAMPVTMENQ